MLFLFFLSLDFFPAATSLGFRLSVPIIPGIHERALLHCILTGCVRCWRIAFRSVTGSLVVFPLSSRKFKRKRLANNIHFTRDTTGSHVNFCCFKLLAFAPFSEFIPLSFL
jgi:hypothetical protein